MSRPTPSSERILDFAGRLAREVHGIEPPEADLRERIEHVLWGRKQAWRCLEDGIINELELRNLLLDHLDYECAHLSGRAWSDFDESTRRALCADLDQLLFGRAARP